MRRLSGVIGRGNRTRKLRLLLRGVLLEGEPGLQQDGLRLPLAVTTLLLLLVTSGHLVTRLSASVGIEKAGQDVAGAELEGLGTGVGGGLGDRGRRRVGVVDRLWTDNDASF